MKFVDDLTLVESINMKKDLVDEDRVQSYPLEFHRRKGLKLDESKCLTNNKLKEIKEYADQCEMKINADKTKVIFFNKSQKYDFMPEIKVIPTENIEVVHEVKLLGIIISEDLKWYEHIAYLRKKGFASLWALRRLKRLGASTNVLLDLYEKQVRSIIEYASPVWGSMLSNDDSDELERVQKAALTIIFGHCSHEEAIKKYKIKSLSERRVNVLKKFAIKTAKHPVFSSWYQKREAETKTRHPKIYVEVSARCERWRMSPIPEMTRY